MTTPRVDDAANAHVSDGLLLALHDGERGADVETGRLHVEQCADCQARLSTLAGYAGRVHESLASVAVPAVDAHEFRRRVTAARVQRVAPVWRRPAFQAAAAIIILAVAAAASPLRHWVEARIARSNAPVTPSPQSAPVVAPKTLSGATVSFATSGPQFTMSLDSVPAAGVLTIDRSAGDEISARVTSGAATGGDDIVVLPGEIRLRNSSSSRASYTLSLPRGVSRLRVVVAGRSIFDGPPPRSVQLSR